ncbi:hypothetical protein [Flavobacterium columnare]|uniref:hypothetical protein n=1 Tax=Flavobacterium columnare TaxID=996 RepID=UPI0013D2DA49|nr:hypothetical protein [Flavobacterium columnare]
MPIKLSDPDGDCPWLLIAGALLIADVAIAPTGNWKVDGKRVHEAKVNQSIEVVSLGLAPGAGRLANKYILKPIVKKSAPIIKKVVAKVVAKKTTEKAAGEVEKQLVQKAGQQAESEVVEKASENAAKELSEKGAYEVAKEGGAHSGFYKNALNQTKEQLEKGIKKLQRQIDEHTELIKNPKEAMKKFGKGDWDVLDPRQQKALLEKKWPSDIVRQKEQQTILKGILDGK